MVVGHKMYNFMDYFSRYYQIAVVSKNKNKTTFLK
uniref:Uncharacterized protein n=2 Tax=Physcomitrium patens TaxID=3218 RepID=A0A7I3ZEY6_PHYPA